jgi:hypothetical protein
MNRYGRAHRAIRAQLMPWAVGSACVRCGRPIEAGQPVDLDHRDDGLGYRGLAHATCNRRAGQERGVMLRQARRHRIMKLENVALGIEVSSDRMHTSIAAAARDGDRVAVALLEYLDGTDTAAAVAEIAGRAVKLNALVIDPRSPAATLIEPLQALSVTVVQPTTHDVAVAHGRFVDELRAGRLRIADHPQLDAAAQHALTRPLAGGEALDRRKPAVDSSPLVAAQLAVWAIVRPALHEHSGEVFVNLADFLDDDN